jgi:hypothetical protein
MFALVATLALYGSPAAAPAAPDPYAIYERAQTFWFSQRYPTYLEYDVAVTVAQNGQERVERYKSSYDATDGAIWVDTVSDYERAHPVVVHGMNVCILTFCATKPLPPIDFIGVPVLTPTYTFGMAPFIAAAPPSNEQSAQELVTEIRHAFHDPYPRGRKPLAAPPKPGLPTIAHASTNAGAYDISLVGVENVDGHDCYHLALRPRRDPGRYRLRDVWVDEDTGATWRLREALNFVTGPGTTVGWTVDFDNLAGVQYIARETSDGPIEYQGQSYAQAIVSFQDVRSVRRRRPIPSTLIRRRRY